MGALQFGIIGCGDGGECNAAALTLAGCKGIAFFDNELNRAITLARSLGIKEASFHSSLYGFLETEVELVVVSTPDHDHLSSTRAALEAGKYVFIEKPLATSFDDLESFLILERGFPQRLFFSEKWTFGYSFQGVIKAREALGPLLTAHTAYTMSHCDRIMGGGKWRTEVAYNPVTGGLSHNFMPIRLIADAPITRVIGRGRVSTYHELERHSGYDTMEGLLEFANGLVATWNVCIAVPGKGSPLHHRTGSHLLQFQNGSFMTGPMPEDDQLVLGGEQIPFDPEAGSAKWRQDYNIGIMYRKMHEHDVLNAIGGNPSLHNVNHGVNVAAACILAFDSARAGGEWMYLPPKFIL